jgi:DNA-binding HxlR family transcriptional regulator
MHAGPGAPADDAIFCPANATLDLLASRGTLYIVRALLSGKKRFNEISRETGLYPTTLRERLKELEHECVLVRHVVSTMPPNVEYELTPKGLALNCIFESLASWGRSWMAPPDGERPDNE